jgi:transcriptional regulator with XRE-family HTH domain
LERRFTIKTEQLRGILSANIKARREALGYSQEKLAEFAGISARMIKEIEGGRTWISDRTLIKLAESLKVDVFQLFVPSGEENSKIVAILKTIRQNLTDNVGMYIDQYIEAESTKMERSN